MLVFLTPHIREISMANIPQKFKLSCLCPISRKENRRGDCEIRDDSLPGRI